MDEDYWPDIDWSEIPSVAHWFMWLSCTISNHFCCEYWHPNIILGEE